MDSDTIYMVLFRRSSICESEGEFLQADSDTTAFLPSAWKGSTERLGSSSAF